MANAAGGSLGKHKFPRTTEDDFPPLGLQTQIQTNYTNTPKVTGPTYLVVHSTDETRHLDKLSPFAIKKAIDLYAGGEVVNVTKERSGNLSVQVRSKRQADILLKQKVFIDIPVEINPHKTRNSSKGVIRCPSFEGITEEDLTQDLTPQGVCETRRITVMRDDRRRPTNTYILTFNTPHPPPYISAGYERVQVEKYIPNPLRCNKCQKYGHHFSKCTANAICAKCGESGHSETNEHPCHKEPKCPRCSGNHAAYSKTCPIREKEKQIVYTKHTCDISFQEARQRVEATLNHPPAFVQAVTGLKPSAKPTPKPTSKDASTQCILIKPPQDIPLNSPMPPCSLESGDRVTTASPPLK